MASVFTLCCACMAFVCGCLLSMTVQSDRKRHSLARFKSQLLYTIALQGVRCLWWPFQMARYKQRSFTEIELELLDLGGYLLDFLLQVDFAAQNFLPQDALLAGRKKWIKGIKTGLFCYQALTACGCVALAVLVIVSKNSEMYVKGQHIMGLLGLLNACIIALVLAAVFAWKCRKYNFLTTYDAAFGAACMAMCLGNVLRFCVQTLVEPGQLSVSVQKLLETFIPGALPPLSVTAFCAVHIRMIITLYAKHSKAQGSQTDTFSFELYTSVKPTRQKGTAPPLGGKGRGPAGTQKPQKPTTTARDREAPKTQHELEQEFVETTATPKRRKPAPAPLSIPNDEEAENENTPLIQTPGAFHGKALGL